MKIKPFITKILLKILWRTADDVTESYESFKELYDNVPEPLKNEMVRVYRIYVYKEKNKKKILEWLNED